MKKGTKVLFVILCLVFVGVFIFAGYKLFSTLHEYKVASDTYSDLSSQYVKSGKEKKEEKKEEEEIVLDPEVCPIEVDFDALREQCPDIVGWIYCPDTVINYPIVQYDDNAYYLHRLINGSYNSSGTLFLDCLNIPTWGCNNNIVYGHHMNDGTMFAKLVDYSKQEYYDAHPKMYILTPKYNYRLELFTGYVTKLDSDTYAITFKDEEANQQWLDACKAESKFVPLADYDVKVGDTICTLSTCTYDYDDARFVVQGKLVPIH